MQPRLILFFIFSWIKKIEKSSRSSIQKSQNLFVNWEKLPQKDQDKKSHILIYGWLRKIYVLSLTVETGNLHKIRLFIFVSNLRWNEWDVLYTSNLRIYQRIGKSLFSARKNWILNILGILCLPQKIWH